MKPLVNFENKDHDEIYNIFVNVNKHYNFKQVGNCINIVTLKGYAFAIIEPDHIGVNYFRIDDIIVQLDDDNIFNEYNDEYINYEIVINYNDEAIEGYDAVIVNDEWYHIDDELIGCCDNCNEHFLLSEGICDDHTTLCDECYQDSYTFCEECDTLTHHDNICYHENSDRSLCEACYNNETDGEPNCNGLHNYSYKPDAIFYGDKGVKYGLELECKFEDQQAAIDDLNEVDYLYLKEDSSISAGFEIVTHPATIDYHKENLCYLLEIIRKDHKGTAHNFGGIHIHIGRNNFNSDKHFSIFYDLINNNLEFTELIAQRNIATWSKINPYNGMKSKDDRCNYNGIGRYSAVNINNIATIEVRIFNGNLRQDRILKNLEYVDALLAFSAEVNTSRLGKFKSFIVKNKNKYSNLYSFLVERDVL